jgi:hypothetical protein
MFERFEKAKQEKSGWRSAAMVVSVLAHVGAAAGLVGWSFWHIERLKTKPVEITQLSLAPPPPALGRPDAPEKPKVAKAKPKPVIDKALSQPTDVKPKDAPPPEDPDEGGGEDTKGQPTGVEGGDPNAPPSVEPPGTGTAEPPPPVAPKIIDIKAMEAQRISGNAHISLPPNVLMTMKNAGQERAMAVVRLCLDASGVPTSVQTVKKTGFSEADAKIEREIRGWRYRPLVVDGRAMPVCAAVQFVYLVD